MKLEIQQIYPSGGVEYITHKTEICPIDNYPG
jgi:hypothetical protein